MEGTNSISIEFEVKVQRTDMTKKELIEAVASGGKLTKADAGRQANTEDWLNVNIDPCESNGTMGHPKVALSFHTKTEPATA